LLRWSPAPLALGGAFACALDGDVVKCWGATARGQVGDGKLTGQDAPVSLGFCGVAQVAAGSAHACMRTRSGEIWCWGLNHDGQLGDGTTEGRPRPIFIPL
jgi:alpha-tubulin suppressor-like RCC1 family protein